MKSADIRMAPMTFGR